MARPRKTKEIYEKELLMKHDGTIKIIGEYIGSNHKTRFRCETCQNEWMARPESVLRGTKCPKCSNKSVKSGNGFLTNLKNKHGTRITTTDLYVRANIKMSFKCNICGNIWSARPYNILSGKGCPECANNRMKKSSEQVLKEIQNAHNGNIIILGDYINGRTKTKFHCTVCGLKWLSIPAHIMNGHGCPKCNFSKGENKIEKYLEKRKLQFTPQYSFSNCKHKRTLPFDYAVIINDQIILIEYDGIFHYKDVFGKKDLEGQQNRDGIKNEFCKNNDIKLIRIPYWDYENIERILDFEFELQQGGFFEA